jgi:hypothetical protein
MFKIPPPSSSPVPVEVVLENLETDSQNISTDTMSNAEKANCPVSENSEERTCKFVTPLLVSSLKNFEYDEQSSLPVTLSDIEDARARINRYIKSTPLVLFQKR